MNPYSIIPHIRYSVHRQTSRGWFISERTIIDHEFVIIEEGKGKVTIEGKVYPVKKGMLFYFPPGIKHSLETDSQVPMSFYGVHFIFTNVEYINTSWNMNTEEKSLGLPNKIMLKNVFSILDLFKQLNKCCINKLPGEELYSRAIFQQLFFEVLKDIQSISTNYAANAKIEKAIVFMKENVSQKLNMPLLAAEVGLSTSYFLIQFKKYTGYSSIEFFNRLKIDKAKNLLQGGNKIKEVAVDIGIYDEFYFSRLFKKIEGISPSAYCSQIVNIY